MKKLILFFALIIVAASCTSEKKHANAADSDATGENTQATEEITETATTTHSDKIFVEQTNADGSLKMFEDVLAEHKGKVIYVDFWATWCPPCRGEMPSSQKLHTQFEDKDVVFLYISFDRAAEAWKKGVEKMDIKGVHYYPSADANQAVSTKYGITSIPRYMLVDKTGKVINQNAPRPSSGQVIAGLIEQNL
ncbi:thiol-disulfide isomerase-like thioredoxin [Bernardetia litoralis DSM 6794]|uniref:Thiol-disulfide isomerase-like thioredoxin n=1 Tax=Bernardetia litoralis (strain ATCC 23117 / DSM 6794 / NBRC 15988 / NCIMB 1366 / Fx l1 / Sio-4) TaxID=880071 RepID=I4AFS6_BERLS|nr:TlpA disulfide reductase family protein [Bernardetia litoralis]AFM02811.1 thiol-disulfide isomerase-like thioredoxin [Bernardetia litoralis DSM 6794]